LDLEKDSTGDFLGSKQEPTNSEDTKDDALYYLKT